MQFVKQESYIFCKAGTAGIGGAAQPLRSNEGESRNPGKPVKNGLLAIFSYKFFAKTCPLFTLTNDAPSMALLVIHKGKMTRCCSSNIC